MLILLATEETEIRLYLEKTHDKKGLVEWFKV
jgi:hypothetical protein